MNKKMQIMPMMAVILVCLTIGIVNASISIGSPNGEGYDRGETVTITATSYAGDSQWIIQIKNAAIVDLGYSCFRFVFVHEGQVSFTRPLYTGLLKGFQQLASEGDKNVKDLVMPLERVGFRKEDAESEKTLSALKPYFQKSLDTVCKELSDSEVYLKVRIFPCNSSPVISE